MDTEPIMNELATRLRVERARLDWTLKEAAEKAGVHFVTISKYESGKKLPTLDALYRLANAYGVEASSLVPPNALGLLPKGKKPKSKE
jgi:transcriptional regulator with XRE-family HTH domain